MITDLELIFADTQDIGTQAAGSVAATNDYDTTATGLTTATTAGEGGSAVQLGTGEPLYWWVNIDEAFDSLDHLQTIQFSLVTDAVEDGIDASSTVVIADPARLLAASTAGTKIVYTLPPNFAYLQYIGVLATVAVTTLTSGMFSSGISAYPFGSLQTAGTGMNLYNP